MKIRVVALGVLLGAQGALPALACSVGVCAAEGLQPQGGTIPANLPAFLWRKMAKAQPDDVESVALTKVGASGQQRIAVRLAELTEAGTIGTVMRIEPELPLELGAKYILSVNDNCASAPGARRSAEYVVGEEVAVPHDLGPISAAVGYGLIAVPDVAACSRELWAAYVDVALQARDDISAHSAVLRYEVLVDGVRGYTAPHSGRPGSARIYTICGDGGSGVVPGVSHGHHRIAVSALLPDQTRISSDDTMVDLVCPAAELPVPPVQRSSRCAIQTSPPPSDVPWSGRLLAAGALLAYFRRRLKRSASARRHPYRGDR